MSGIAEPITPAPAVAPAAPATPTPAAEPQPQGYDAALDAVYTKHSLVQQQEPAAADPSPADPTPAPEPAQPAPQSEPAAAPAADPPSPEATEPKPGTPDPWRQKVDQDVAAAARKLADLEARLEGQPQGTPPTPQDKKDLNKAAEILQRVRDMTKKGDLNLLDDEQAGVVVKALDALAEQVESLQRQQAEMAEPVKRAAKAAETVEQEQVWQQLATANPGRDVKSEWKKAVEQAVSEGHADYGAEGVWKRANAIFQRQLATAAPAPAPQRPVVKVDAPPAPRTPTASPTGTPPPGAGKVNDRFTGGDPRPSAAPADLDEVYRRHSLVKDT